MTDGLLRRRLALACLTAAIAGQLALPLVHTLVHRLEAALARPAPTWRVEASPRPTSGAAHRHGSGPAHRHGDPSRPRHHHGGDHDGRPHGADAPEHLTAHLAPTAAPLGVFRPLRVAPAIRPAPSTTPALAPPPSRHHNRGPPTVI